MFVFVSLLPVSPEPFEAEVEWRGGRGSVMVHLVRGSYCGKTGGGGSGGPCMVLFPFSYFSYVALHLCL